MQEERGLRSTGRGVRKERDFSRIHQIYRADRLRLFDGVGTGGSWTKERPKGSHTSVPSVSVGSSCFTVSLGPRGGDFPFQESLRGWDKGGTEVEEGEERPE